MPARWISFPARAGAKEALANGVLILLVPPMVFFVLIAVVVYRYRNKFREMSVVCGGELPMVDCRLVELTTAD
jgi:hypothetical protein